MRWIACAPAALDMPTSNSNESSARMTISPSISLSQVFLFHKHSTAPPIETGASNNAELEGYYFAAGQAIEPVEEPTMRFVASLFADCSPDGAISVFTRVFDALWRNPGQQGRKAKPSRISRSEMRATARTPALRRMTAHA